MQCNATNIDVRGEGQKWLIQVLRHLNWDSVTSCFFPLFWTNKLLLFVCGFAFNLDKRLKGEDWRDG